MNRKESVKAQELEVRQIDSLLDLSTGKGATCCFAQCVVKFWDFLQLEVLNVKTLQKLKHS